MELKEKPCQMVDKLEKVQPGLAVDKMMKEEQPTGEAEPFPVYGSGGGPKSFFKRPLVLVVLTFLCIAVFDISMVMMAKVSPHTVDVNLESTEATVFLGLALNVPFHLSSLSVSQIYFWFLLLQ
jgi:hypothetical protein